MFQIVGITEERVTNTTDTEFPYHHVGEDHAWDLEEFRQASSVNFDPIALLTHSRLSKPKSTITDTPTSPSPSSPCPLPLQTPSAE